MKLSGKLLWVLVSGCLTYHGLASTPENTPHPNVIVVLTDDQGYGDMSCHCNPILQNPNTDHLSKDGVRLKTSPP